MIHIQVDLKPIPKARPRFNTHTGRIYTPSTTTDFESHVSFFAKREVKVPLEGGIEITLVFKFIKAKSSKLNLHIKRPDIDNLIKSVLDGLNGIAFKDDAQIVKLHSEKKFAERDGVDIFIEEIASEEKPQIAKSQLEKEEGLANYGEFPWDIFDALLQCDPSKRFCREYLKCSDDKIERAIRKKFDMTFDEYKAVQLEHTVHSIKQAAIIKAKGGNSDMIKYVLSNIGNWTDKKEVSFEDVTDRELVDAVQSLLAKKNNVS